MTDDRTTFIFDRKINKLKCGQRWPIKIRVVQLSSTKRREEQANSRYTKELTHDITAVFYNDN